MHDKSTLTIHDKSTLTLEYPKILEKVAREAAFSASKELVRKLQPTPDIDEARRRLAYTTEAYRLIEKLDADSFPLLHALGADIPQRPPLVRRIEETISQEGEVLDTASPALRKLRFDIRGANQRLQDRLRTLVHEFGNALQEPIITIRSDRYVVPVKAESRNH